MLSMHSPFIYLPSNTSFMKKSKLFLIVMKSEVSFRNSLIHALCTLGCSELHQSSQIKPTFFSQLCMTKTKKNPKKKFKNSQNACMECQFCVNQIQWEGPKKIFSNPPLMYVKICVLRQGFQKCITLGVISKTKLRKSPKTCKISKYPELVYFSMFLYFFSNFYLDMTPSVIHFWNPCLKTQILTPIKGGFETKNFGSLHWVSLTQKWLAMRGF